MSAAPPLKFRVASHIVEDLGLNLYTSLPRVLVEFVANAYDADSPFVDIKLDKKAIEKQRKIVKAAYDGEAAELEDDPETPLAMRSLANNVEITISDTGIGMSRDDLQEKFLVAGRRRRLSGETQTAKGRAIMGRKGLGKLAGFGVAKTVTIVTRVRGAKTATKIVLDYNDLVKNKTTEGIVVPEKELHDKSILPEGGTIITLSQLLYDPMKARETTIDHEIADHFALVDSDDFAIRVNGRQVKPTHRSLVYAWPEPERSVDEFTVKHLDLSAEGSGKITFRYRMRFTSARNSLRAAERGVRIYANKRLAAAPSLLDADTNMHGFRMSDYLDGVVHADFIDQQPADYIATDRQGLRWDSPALTEMRSFLSVEIKEACKSYQKKRDLDNAKEVKDDSFTNKLISESQLVGNEKKLARKVARALSAAHPAGIEDDGYRNTLPSVIQAIGHGSILTTITRLAKDDHPPFAKLVVEITRLTKDELESFTRRARTRLTAIEALQKIVRSVDFKEADNEKDVQKLLEKNPWLIDPTYTQFLTADTRLDSVVDRIARHLEIGGYAPGDVLNPDKRPDLVFLLGNAKLGRLVIIELKSPNKPLDSSHLEQLELYMEHAEQWLEAHGHSNIRVEGQLIGSHASPSSRAEKVAALRRRMRKTGPTEPWKVRDYLDVLNETLAAHQELLDVQASTGASEADEDDDD